MNHITPEPSTFLLATLGMLSLGILAWPRRYIMLTYRSSLALSIAAAAVMILGLKVSTASAAPIVFSDRLSWEAAAGGTPDFFEDFNSINSDVSWNPAPLAIGFLTIDNILNESIFNLIDAPPTRLSQNPFLDGTTAMLFHAGGLFSPSSDFENRVTFSSPVAAFGFDIGMNTSSFGVLRFETSEGSFEVSIGPTYPNQFLGVIFDADEKVNFVDFKSTEGNNTAHADNFAAFSAIPEPSSFLLATLGLLGIGWRRRKRA